MTTAEFALPDAGEGLTEAEIVSWRVAVGESVTVNQVLVEIETAKSLVELPSPFAGVVTAILVTEGQTVPVGTPIIAVETTDPVVAAVDGGGPAADAQLPPARDTVADTLRSWGHAVAGATSRAHRDPRLRYKAVWVDA